jgi:hypothetical protein
MKIDKYVHLKRQYENKKKGYDVFLDAVVFGDIGGTDDHNAKIMQGLIRASPRYTEHLHCRCVESVLQHGYKIWATRCNCNHKFCVFQ